MNSLAFETPVSVVVGFGTPTKIETVLEALALLDDWPPSQRKAEHSVALKACRAALAGDIDPETARATFVAFARRNDLLAPDATVEARRKDGAGLRLADVAARGWRSGLHGPAAQVSPGAA